MARILLRIVAIIIILMGLGWAGQGRGYIDWPKESFMVDNRPWVWRGLAFAAVGLVLLFLSLRRPRT